MQDVEWQPISALPQIAAVMDELLEEIREFHATLGEAPGKPHVMDDDTLDQVDRQYQEHTEYLGLFAEQLRR